MRSILATTLIALSLSAVDSCGSIGHRAGRLSEDEKHRLYAAALSASDAPLESDLFKDVCRKIDIFDASGKPNQKYMGFVSEHIHWSMEPEHEGFWAEINTREKARQYVTRHSTVKSSTIENQLP
ncbi:MAG TPA: hypothetical protein VKD91_16860 [Pyrinomonadaceae bacterium]|nr:hypothetical protein [Pyrinomonadaceae bacterium]